MKALYVLLLLLILAGCGGGSGSSNLGIPVIQPPTISSIGDQSVNANTVVGPIAFSVDDPDSSTELNVEAATDNIALIAGIAIEGSGSERTLVIMPSLDGVGSANITVTVTDSDGLSASSTFSISFNLIETSFNSFVRDVFAGNADAQPLEINVLDFNQDADSFDDLVEG